MNSFSQCPYTHSFLSPLTTHFSSWLSLKMEGLDSTDFPKNWLSLKSINYSTTDMAGGDEEDDRNVIFRGNLDDQGGRSRSTEANQNMTRRSFRSEEEAKCPVCSRSFGSMKAMHGHMRCHPERGWRGVKCPVPPPPSSAKKSASSSSDSSSHASTHDIHSGSI